MAFTGRLGTADSQLGQFELASVGTTPTPTQTIQLRANIQATTPQSLQMRARIRGVGTLDMRARIQPAHSSTIDLRARIQAVGTQSLQMRASIQRPEGTIQMRARIRGAYTLDMRARILGIVTSADFEITYDVQNVITERLVVLFDATDKSRNFKTIKMQARILAQTTAGLAISYDVDYTMPDGCVVTRPRQRAVCRVVRTLSLKARITDP